MSDEPPPPAPRPPGSPIALGCGGFVSFFALALVVGLAATALGWLVLAPIAVGVVVAVRSLRAATPAGRANAARFAVGFAVAAVIFGGCIVAIGQADFR